MPEPRETHAAIDARRDARMSDVVGEEEAARFIAEERDAERRAAQRRRKMPPSVELRYCRNALADALAERDALAATVQRVEALCEQWEGWTDTPRAAALQPPLPVKVAARDLRTALDPVTPWQPSDGDTRCQDCRHTYQPWFTANGIWNRVMGGPDARDDPGGCLCPRCFMERADVVYPRMVWRLAPSDPATDTGGEAR